MNFQMIGFVCAVLGALATIAYLALGVSGRSVLRDIRDRLGSDKPMTKG